MAWVAGQHWGWALHSLTSCRAVQLAGWNPAGLAPIFADLVDANCNACWKRASRRRDRCGSQNASAHDRARPLPCATPRRFEAVTAAPSNEAKGRADRRWPSSRKYGERQRPANWHIAARSRGGDAALTLLLDPDR
jgi:hypothetical protein